MNEAITLAVNLDTADRIFRKQWHLVESLGEFGPCGHQWRIGGYLRNKETNHIGTYVGSIIVSQADHTDGHEWIHASIAWPEHTPSYLDLAVLHRAIFGRKRWAYQVFVPALEHVNLHENALHLFGRVDGAQVLPDFTPGNGVDMRQVHTKDAQGRPREVTFSGDPATQCPGCLSKEVEPFPAIGFVPVGGDFAPIRRMRCRDCRANWTRAGL